MLQEQETPARAEYARDLRQDRLRVVDGAERPGGDDGVDGAGVEWKTFGWGSDDRCVPAGRLESGSEAFEHVGVGFGERELADGLWVVVQCDGRLLSRCELDEANVVSYAG